VAALPTEAETCGGRVCHRMSPQTACAGRGRLGRNCFSAGDFDMTSSPTTGGILGLSALGTPSPPKPDQPYFAALGTFITSYAGAEHQVHLLARHLTRLNDAKARIVFSGMRLGDLAERIRGLLRVTRAKSERFNEADTCLKQLDLIASQRNNLVHRFVMFTGEAIEVTNIVIAKSIENPETQTFSMADFENMESDCVAIRKWIRQPWRYKPPQPAQKRKLHP
jgi:hypothetical protein